MALLADQPAVRVVSMFGAKSVMVNEKLLASALKNGGLLVRVDPKRHNDLLRRPGAKQAEKGTGRTMGPGWIEVGAEALGTTDQLASWIDSAMEYNRAVTGS